jgi:hypothetical protein
MNGRYYRLTVAGAQQARAALAEAGQAKRRVRIPRPVAEPS